MDIDGDGTLTRRELRMLLSGLSRSLSEEIIAELVNKADTNRDGVITFREFKEAAQQELYSGSQGGNVVTGLTRAVTGNKYTAKGPQFGRSATYKAPRSSSFVAQPIDYHQPSPKAIPRHNYMLTQEEICDLQIAFRKSDTNRDGVLNRREVNILMLQLGANVTEEQVI